ncbi:MAG: hypothetical protein H8E64_01720, partial [Candidatus Marinimicrobia bacterium]|nr:hypothetical protein [Candidatus Neomarinimicrobiota bacterium]
MLSNKLLIVCFILVVSCLLNIGYSQDEAAEIDSGDCIDCHETGKHETLIEKDLSNSIHDGFECLECHEDMDTAPHDESSEFYAGDEGCRNCHDDASDEYEAHGRMAVGKCEDMPQCMDCHGDHDILPSDVKLSKTH